MNTNGPNAEQGQSRRDFLAKTSALAGLAATLGMAGCSGERTSEGPLGVSMIDPSPAPKAGPGTPIPDGGTINLGVIGVGGMGTGHVEAYLSIAARGKNKEDFGDNVKIVAVSDVCDSHADRAAGKIDEKQGGKCDKYRKYKDLLARPDIHAVVIASPEHWHSQMGIDAILAGKDVYLEKPMTLRLEQAMALRKVVQANPERILQVGTQYMQFQRYKDAKKIIAEGGIGKPTFSQTSYCRNSRDGEWLYYEIDPKWKPGVNLDWDAWCGPLGPHPWDPAVYARWRRYRTWSTGIIGDLLVHWMTPMVEALDMGWPVRVTASGGHLVDKKMENHDQVNITVEFEKEHIMIVAGSTCNENGLETIIRGHKANIFLNSGNCVVRPEAQFSKEVDPQEIKASAREHHDPQDLHRLSWLSCLRKREQPLSNVELGTRIMVIVDLATRSLWEGKAYRFDPKTMTVTEA